MSAVTPAEVAVAIRDAMDFGFLGESTDVVRASSEFEGEVMIEFGRQTFVATIDEKVRR